MACKTYTFKSTPTFLPYSVGVAWAQPRDKGNCNIQSVQHGGGGGGTYVKWYKSYDNVCLSFHKQLLKLSVGGHHTKKECGAVVAV